MGFADPSVVKCDGNLNGWYRITGKAGDQLADKCVPIKRCGTLATGWLNGQHPTVEELVVTREVCYHSEDDCCKFKNDIEVRNCGDFYVYKLRPTPSCQSRYCGNKDIELGDECQSGHYKVLDEADRAMRNTDRSNVKCDRNDISYGWYRITGGAGDQIPEKCVPEYHCGTHVPGWLNGKHPTVQEGIVTRQVCYRWEGNCCKFKNDIRIRNCGDYYVYELQKPPNCDYRYCGNNNYIPEDCFKYSLGISDQAEIPDNHMTASSQYDAGRQPAYGRLNGDRGDGWCSKARDSNDDWLQVDLGKTFRVCGVASQGDRNGNEWVTDFKLSYSSDGIVWTPYKDENGVEVEFHRQGGSNTVDKHILSVLMSARYVRFHPTKRHNWNCLRVELYSADYKSKCDKVDWQVSLDRTGWSVCPQKNTYLKGLWRNDRRPGDERVGLIEYGRCCTASEKYFADQPADCNNANWRSTLDRNNVWALCPDGFFLNGLYKGDGKYVNSIEEGQCCRPQNQQEDGYDHCYDEDVSLSFDDKGWSKCQRDGFYMTGIYKGGCQEINCIEKFKCCRMKTAMGTCDSSQCLNGGYCTNEAEGKYSCKCQNGWFGERCETGYDLLFPKKGTSDYVIINNAMPSLTAVTICLWMKVTDTGNKGTPLSYAVSGSDNELVLFNYNGFSFEVAGVSRQTSVSANDGKWHHICATWDNTAGSWKLFKDGKQGASGTDFKKGHVIPGGGALVLAQEQDSLGGGFGDTQNFIGEMTGVNIWDHVITDQEIMRMSQSCQTGVGNVFKWSDFKDHVKGSVKIIESSC
ncbi:uncharacterized protein LOC144638135 [Oculina patagonica]